MATAVTLHVCAGTIAIVDISSQEGTRMAQLIVRNLDEDLVRRLRQRASEHGRSAEEEHRQILRAALRNEGLGAYLVEIPAVGEDEDFARVAESPRPVDL